MADMTSREFGYGRWFDTPSLSPKVGKPADNVELHAATDVFLANMARVEALGRLPLGLVTLGISKGHADVIARAKGTSVDEAHRELRNNQQWLEGIAADAKHLADQAGNSTDPSVRKAFQSLAAATVIMSYAAIETLLTDLVFAATAMRKELLQRLPNNVRNRIQSGKGIGRKNLAQFRELFERMFPEENGKPAHELSKNFASFYGGLLVMEAARNLFAHRCGIVDDTFVRLVETSRVLRELKSGDELFLNFEIARAQAGLTRDLGVFVIRFIDWWLNTHPVRETLGI